MVLAEGPAIYRLDGHTHGVLGLVDQGYHPVSQGRHGASVAGPYIALPASSRYNDAPEDIAVKYRVQIDPDLCIGTSQCAEVAPDAYEMNADHTLSVLKAAAKAESILNGAMSCPVGAITLFDAETGKQVFPKLG